MPDGATTRVIGDVVGRQLRWTSAGHLPPLLVHPDGTAEYLPGHSDLPRGVDPRTERNDLHAPPGPHAAAAHRRARRAPQRARP